MQKTYETWVPTLDGEDTLEEGMATHSSVLAWRLPMDIRAWWATVLRVTKSWTQLKQLSKPLSTSYLYSRSWLRIWRRYEAGQEPCWQCWGLQAWQLWECASQICETSGILTRMLLYSEMITAFASKSHFLWAVPTQWMSPGGTLDRPIHWRH